jgi:hypothetical protein
MDVVYVEFHQINGHDAVVKRVRRFLCERQSGMRRDVEIRSAMQDLTVLRNHHDPEAGETAARCYRRLTAALKIPCVMARGSQTRHPLYEQSGRSDARPIQ